MPFPPFLLNLVYRYPTAFQYYREDEKQQIIQIYNLCFVLANNNNNNNTKKIKQNTKENQNQQTKWKGWIILKLVN